MSDSVEEAAERLRLARESLVPCAPVRDLIDAQNVAGAYAVQAVLVERGVSAGGRVVGAKIGLTSPAVQTAFGVYEPDFGTLFADMSVPSDQEIPAGLLIQPRVEAEVAFILGRDLPSEQTTAADVLRATEYILPAIEIVDSRIADWDITLVDTIADNASSGMFVLGGPPRTIEAVDLRLCGMVLRRCDEPCSVGAGAATMGNPVTAMTWLACTLARAGHPLSAGDVVLSGALGPMVQANPGDVFEASISELGSVRAVFGKEKN